jgi:site-specific recombinase XerD
MSDLRQMPLFANQPAAVADLNPKTELRFTIALFQQHLLKEGKSQHTVNAFTSDMQLLAEQAGAEIPIGDITTNSLNDYLEWMEHERGVSCSRKTYARRVTTLKVYFKWLYQVNALPHDPAKAVLQRSGPAPLGNALDQEQIRACLLAARGMHKGDQLDTRPEMLFRLILDTGIKKSEAMLLTPASVDRSNAQHPSLLVKYKVRNIFKDRRIPLDPDWLRIFESYMAQYAPGDTIFNCTSRNLEYILSDVGDSAGLPFKLSFESLRWSSAVRDIRAGHEEDVVRDKLGLSPISWHETRSKIHRFIELQVKPNRT